MALTLADARDLVLARLGVAEGEADLVALVDLQLNAEYQLLVVEHELIVDTASLITTAGDPVIDLPNDVAMILRLLWGRSEMEPKTWTEFSEAIARNSSELFYVRSGINQIRVSLLPEADSEDITCWYAQEAPAWDDDIETPDALPSAFHVLPVERTVEWLALAEEEQGLASIAKARADALEVRLRRHLARRMGKGPAVITIKGMG